MSSSVQWAHNPALKAALRTEHSYDRTTWCPPILPSALPAHRARALRACKGEQWGQGSFQKKGHEVWTPPPQPLQRPHRPPEAGVETWVPVDVTLTMESTRPAEGGRAPVHSFALRGSRGGIRVSLAGPRSSGGGSQQLPQTLICSHPGVCKRGANPAARCPAQLSAEETSPSSQGPSVRQPARVQGPRLFRHSLLSHTCLHCPGMPVNPAPLQTPIHPSRLHSRVPTSSSIPQGPLLPLFRACRMCSHHPTPKPFWKVLC